MLYARLKRGENRQFLERGDHLKTSPLPKVLVTFSLRRRLRGILDLVWKSY